VCPTKHYVTWQPIHAYVVSTSQYEKWEELNSQRESKYEFLDYMYHVEFDLIFSFCKHRIAQEAICC